MFLFRGQGNSIPFEDNEIAIDGKTGFIVIYYYKYIYILYLYFISNSWFLLVAIIKQLRQHCESEILKHDIQFSYEEISIAAKIL